MAKLTQSGNIKRKILSGFIVLLALALIAVYSVIKLATQLSPADPNVSISVSKLSYTSNLLSGIIEAGGQARAFISTGDSQYFIRYLDEIIIVDQAIDSLKIKSISNTNQYLRILSVDSLITLKNLTFQNYFNLRRDVVKGSQSNYNTILNNYINTYKSADKTISQTIREQVPPKEEKKKKFFPKLWNSISGKKNKHDSTNKTLSKTIISDTSIAFTAFSDTNFKKVKKHFNHFEEQQTKQRELLAERELMLVQADQDIMNEIRAILLLFEKEEISKAIQSTEKGQEVLNRLWFMAFILATAGLLTVIAFIFLIWKDLARSNYYRKQLEEARILAESLLKVKEQFLANISHEIRTPLTSIIGFSERLTSTNIDNDQRKFIKYINSSSEHLLELINDLLDFSRINSGRIELESKIFNPALLFEQAFETLSSRAKSKDLQIIYRHDLPEMNAIGDPLRLRQIFINLLSNSIKFTNEGSVTVQVKANFQQEQGTLLLQIRVADTGIGIPHDKLNLIFDEFTQVDPELTRKFGGSGLGLAITKKLVELMHGQIIVLSRPGRGTLFSIKLSLPATTKSVENKPTTLADGSQLSGINILIAEDDETTQVLLTELLTNHAADVTITANGNEAFQAFIKAPLKYAILVTDIQMPVLSGPELVNKINNYCIENKIAPPITIGLTAHASNNMTSKFLEKGFNFIIFKPFRQADILNAIKSIQTSSSNVIITNTGSPNTSLEENKTYEGKELKEYSLNFEAFKQFTGNDNEALRKVINSLLENIKNTHTEMHDAYTNSDIDRLGLLAHRLVPNIKLLGATPACNILRKLEYICKNSNNKSEEITLTYSIASEELTDIMHEIEKIKVLR